MKYVVAFVEQGIFRSRYTNSPTLPGYTQLISREVMKEVDDYETISLELLRVLFYLAVKYDNKVFDSKLVWIVKRNMNSKLNVRGRNVVELRDKIAAAEKEIASLLRNIEAYKLKIQQEEENEDLVSLTAKIAYKIDSHPEYPAVLEAAKQELSS
jgi:hypothetical protein